MNNFTKALVEATAKPATVENVVLYHGSNCDFQGFEQEKLGRNTGYVGADSGAFLTSKRNLAEMYAQGAVGSNGGEVTVMEFEVSLNNAKYYDSSTEYYRELDALGDKWAVELKEQGYDGVIVRDDLEEVVVFDVGGLKRVVEEKKALQPTP